MKLSSERLAVSKHDFVYEDILANSEIVDQKQVMLQRSPEGILGVVIQGGIDWKSPVKVNKLIDNSPASRSGQIEELDIIIKVDNELMWGKTHDEAAKIIKNAGQTVTFHIGKLQLKEMDGEPVEVPSQWLLLADVPLKCATLSFYRTGTAILKPNAFQILSQDKSAKVTLHCLDAEQLREWSGAVSSRIAALTNAAMAAYNEGQGEHSHEKVVWMGWVHERLNTSQHTKVWQRKYLVVWSMKLQLYSTVPESQADWARAEKSYQLLEMTLRVLEPHEFPEQRANAVVLTSGKGTSHIVAFGGATELKSCTGAFRDATISTVLHLKKQQFLGHWREQPVYFSLDTDNGFSITDRHDLANVLWQRPFSSLRHSSDDGHLKLQLECFILDSQQTEKQEVLLEDLHAAVCTMECFFTAQVSQADPAFLQQLA